MKILSYLVLALTVLGCNPTPAPAPSVPDASTAPPPSSGQVSSDEGRGGVVRQPAKPFVPKVDSRTPAQVAMAACSGANGSPCSIARRLMASGNGSAGQCGPACTVPNWYLDFANTTGCAADSNSGTSATCSGAGIGPLLHIAQLYARWGAHDPFLASSTEVTTITVMSPQPSGSASADPWGNFSPSAPDGMVAVVGTLQAIGTSFTIGTVTQPSRANPGNDFEVLLGTAGAAAAPGQLLYNSGIAGGSYTWIDSLTGSGVTLTAVCTAPYAATGLTTPYNTTSLTYDAASWSSGQMVQLYTAPTIYADSVGAIVGTGSSFGSGHTSGAMWIQGVNFGDPAGVGYNSTVTISLYGSSFLSLVRTDAAAQVESHGNIANGNFPPNIQSSWFNAGVFLTGSFGNVYGGAVATSGSGGFGSAQAGRTSKMT